MYYDTGNLEEGRKHTWLVRITVLLPAGVRRENDTWQDIIGLYKKDLYR